MTLESSLMISESLPSEGKGNSKGEFLKCSQCDYQCEYPSRLERHETTHRAKNIVSSRMTTRHSVKSEPDIKEENQDDSVFNTSCPPGDKIVNAKCENGEIGSTNKEKELVCKQCGHRFRQPWDLKRHMMTHTDEEERVKLLKFCPISNCSFSTIHESCLTRHRKRHSNKKPYKCSSCKLSFKTSSELRKHRIVHSESEERNQFLKFCPVSNCSFSTIHQSCLSRHRKKHLNIKPYKCSACKYSCRSPYELRKHRIVHSVSKERKRSLKFCTFPDCTFATLYSVCISRHLKIHSGEKPFKCSSCEFSARERSDLKRHQIIHEPKEKQKAHLKNCPFPNCNYSTLHAKDVKRHFKIHKTDVALKCHSCEFSSTDPLELSGHQILHDLEVKPEEIVIECTFPSCDFKTLHRASLSRHIRRHSEDRPFKCSFCDYSCRLVYELRRHTLRRHSGTNEPRTNSETSEGITYIKEESESQYQGSDSNKHPTSEMFLDHIPDCILNCPVEPKIEESNEERLDRKTQDGLCLPVGTKPSTNLEDLECCLFSCKWCKFLTDDNNLIALHNEEVHSIPYVVLELL